MLVSKELILWGAYIWDLTIFVFLGIDDMFIFNHLYAQERSVFIKMEHKFAICVFFSIYFVYSYCNWFRVLN